MNPTILEEVATARKIKVHEPFAEFLNAQPSMHTFELSLLDCYRMAGHACHAITSAFLLTEKAVSELFPETKTCERGDILVEFGSKMDERATGPRSNTISYITGSWGESGFPGLQGNFKRKNLISYGHSEIGERAVQFQRITTGRRVVLEYDAHLLLDSLHITSSFPNKWREELCAILSHSDQVIQVRE